MYSQPTKPSRNVTKTKTRINLDQNNQNFYIQSTCNISQIKLQSSVNVKFRHVNFTMSLFQDLRTCTNLAWINIKLVNYHVMWRSRVQVVEKSLIKIQGKEKIHLPVEPVHAEAPFHKFPHNFLVSTRKDTSSCTNCTIHKYS